MIRTDQQRRFDLSRLICKMAPALFAGLLRPSRAPNGASTGPIRLMPTPRPMHALPRLATRLLLAAAALVPLSAQAWWNGDFKERTKITINTSAAGVETHDP